MMADGELISFNCFEQNSQHLLNAFQCLFARHDNIVANTIPYTLRARGSTLDDLCVPFV